MKRQFANLCRSTLILLVLTISCVTAKVDISEYDFRDGDILLQHNPSRLSSVIADVSDSQYSHCGMIVHRHGKPYVIEAVGPVKYTPIANWIDRGISDRFAQFRPKSLTADQIKKAIEESARLLGKPYDIQYELDEEKIYCSELLYKAFLRGCNIEIGTKTTLGELDWKPHEKFIRHIAHGELPLDRTMVTPESLAKSPHVSLVYTSFPRREKDGELYNTAVLKGKWTGDYTINGLEKATAELTLGDHGKFESGHIVYKHKRIPITAFSAVPFSNAKKFTARIKDKRKIEATIKAHIKDHGNKIIGNWKDNSGSRGVFSFGRK